MRVYIYFIGILFLVPSFVLGKAQQVNFVFLGDSFSRGEFPWMVALLDKITNPPAFFCAGTLISWRHVVTGKNKNFDDLETWSMRKKNLI